jgi:uncharacterized protein DUF6602
MSNNTNRDMDFHKHNIPYFINLALQQGIQEQNRIIDHAVRNKSLKEHSKLIKNIGIYNLELQQWQMGRFNKSNPLKYFGGQALKLEKQGDRLAEKLWSGNCLSLYCIFNYANLEKEYSKNKFEMMLRTHFDIQRIRLLEQIRGARLLQQNSDLGDDVEKVFVEYLQQNLDNDCKVVRGGHIFDQEGNRSKQIDIMVIQAKTFSMCPASTLQGKHNVTVDQVIAAISVKSTLTEKEFEDAWLGIQSIPIYSEQDEDYVGLKDNAWPLCFIVCANSSDIRDLDNKWSSLSNNPTHELQLFMSLEKGFSTSSNVSWPLRSNVRGEELIAGLGLGLMINSILARSAYLAKRSLSFYKKQSAMFYKATIKAGCGSPINSPKYNKIGPLLSINEIIRWQNMSKIYYSNGEIYRRCLHLNNELTVNALLIRDKRLVNTERPILRKLKTGDGQLYESRWFEWYSEKTVDDILYLTEWLQDEKGISYHSRIVKFNLITGDEVFD